MLSGTQLIVIICLQVTALSTSETWIGYKGYNCYENHGASDLEIPAGSSCGTMTKDACFSRCIDYDSCQGVVVGLRDDGLVDCYKRTYIILTNCDQQQDSYTTFTLSDPPISKKYKVSVNQTVLQTLITNAPNDAPETGTSSSYASFSFHGNLAISVTLLTRMDTPSSVTIRPYSAKASKPKLSKDEHGHPIATFSLPQPGQISVEFQFGNDKIFNKDALFIFANPPELNPLNPKTPGVTVVNPGTDVSMLSGKVYFAPGVHYLHKALEITQNQTIVYLAPGAYVYARIVSNNILDSVHIYGRGVFDGDGKNLPHCTNMDKWAMLTLKGSNHYVEGVVFVGAPAYNININPWWLGCENNNKCTSARVINVKAISHYYCTDGVNTGKNSEIRDSFFRVNDDSIKVYDSHMIVSGITLWQKNNGWSFMLGWYHNYDVSNVSVTKCSVIHGPAPTSVSNSSSYTCGIFGSYHGKKGNYKDYLFQDINVESKVKSNFAFQYQDSGQCHGDISNIVFERIQLANPGQYNIIEGHKNKQGCSSPVGYVSAMQFNKVTFNGQPFTRSNINIHSDTTRDITFDGK